MIKIKQALAILGCAAFSVTAFAPIANADIKPIIEVTDFNSLASHLSAGDGDTLKLTQNITLTKSLTLPAGKTVELDLNGQALVAPINPGTKRSFTGIENHGTLTIINSSNNAGSITARNVIDNYGKVFLKSGTLIADNNGGGSAIWNNPGASAEITGGILRATGTSASLKAAIPVVNEGNAVITGGKFEAKYTNILSSGGSLVAKDVNFQVTETNWMAVKSTGGTMSLQNIKTEAVRGGCYNADGKSTMEIINSVCHQSEYGDWNSTAIAASNGATVNVRGGEYISSAENGNGAYIFTTGGTINIYSGLVKAPTAIRSKADKKYQDKTFAINVYDGKLSGEIKIDETSKLNITGGKFANLSGAEELLSQFVPNDKKLLTDADGFYYFGNEPAVNEPSAPSTTVQQSTGIAAPANTPRVVVAEASSTPVSVSAKTETKTETTPKPQITETPSTVVKDVQSETQDNKQTKQEDQFPWIIIIAGSIVTIIIGTIIYITNKR